ncbi:oocyte zinc finger protein XlCOF29-like [Spea bombifrons]|uniref:oocyte zinc finger protein XlCOF29-like n=1 Tax=Spea bombifrons TaxID=233779 RepID=UPI00234A4595|nr:oocyte zinc finger protein XlCOF29-like [Spea bombifrons]
MESDGDRSFPVIMNVRRKETSERILDLTLEMIYVLTGQDYILPKKPCDRTAHSRHPRASKESSGTRNPGTEPPTREENGKKKILGLASKIIQLLTGQVRAARDGASYGKGRRAWLGDDRVAVRVRCPCGARTWPSISPRRSGST